MIVTIIRFRLAFIAVVTGMLRLTPVYRDCQKNVPIEDRFSATNPYTAIIFSEHYYDKRYNLDSLANPPASCGECARYCGSMILALLLNLVELKVSEAIVKRRKE